MAKYKVIALSVGGLNKKIYNSNDIVTEENFPEGNVPELVKGGFLEEIKDKAPKAEKSEKQTNKTKEEKVGE